MQKTKENNKTNKSAGPQRVKKILKVPKELKARFDTDYEVDYFERMVVPSYTSTNYLFLRLAQYQRGEFNWFDFLDSPGFGVTPYDIDLYVMNMPCFQVATPTAYGVRIIPKMMINELVRRVPGSYTSVWLTNGFYDYLVECVKKNFCVVPTVHCTPQNQIHISPREKNIVEQFRMQQPQYRRDEICVAFDLWMKARTYRPEGLEVVELSIGKLGRSFGIRDKTLGPIQVHDKEEVLGCNAIHTLTEDVQPEDVRIGNDKKEPNALGGLIQSSVVCDELPVSTAKAVTFNQISSNLDIAQKAAEGASRSFANLSMMVALYTPLIDSLIKIQMDQQEREDPEPYVPKTIPENQALFVSVPPTIQTILDDTVTVLPVVSCCAEQSLPVELNDNLEGVVMHTKTDEDTPHVYSIPETDHLPINMIEEIYLPSEEDGDLIPCSGIEIIAEDVMRYSSVKLRSVVGSPPRPKLLHCPRAYGRLDLVERIVHAPDADHHITIPFYRPPPDIELAWVEKPSGEFFFRQKTESAKWIQCGNYYSTPNIPMGVYTVKGTSKYRRWKRCLTWAALDIGIKPHVYNSDVVKARFADFLVVAGPDQNHPVLSLSVLVWHDGVQVRKASILTTSGLVCSSYLVALEFWKSRNREHSCHWLWPFERLQEAGTFQEMEPVRLSSAAFF